MKVLFLTSGFPCPSDPISGIFHRTLANALVKKGLKVEVVAPVPFAPKFLGLLSKLWNSYNSIPISYISDQKILVHRPRYLMIPKMGDYLFLHKQFSSITNLAIKERPDIIHAHYSYPCGLAAVDLANQWNVPSVLTLHGSDVNLFPYKNQWSKTRFQKSVSAQDQVIAVSHALAEKTKIISGISPEIIPIGVDTERFASLPSKKDARRQLHLPTDAFILVFIGMLKPTKGISELLAALKILYSDGVLGVFCGEGPMLEQARQTSTVIAPGLIKPEMIPLYLAAADLLILPSYHEGMPTVLIESGFVGTPIIATSVGGIPELLGEDRGFLIQPKSVEDIVSAVRTVKNNFNEAEFRAKKLKAYLKSEYDVNHSANKIIAIYEKCIRK